MRTAQDKIVQHLNEAHATELALVNTLTAHISMTPHGTYRNGLEKHLRETRQHAENCERRLGELGQGKNVVQAGVGAVQSVVGQVLSLTKGPIDLVRGPSGEEKLLKNAKDEAATEALEVATYTALQRLARLAGDEKTEKLATEHLAQDQRMLDNLLKEIPKLTTAAYNAEVKGEPTYDPTETGAADAVKVAGAAAKSTAQKANRRARTTARQARKVPGVAQAEGQAKGAVADAGDLAIANYDKLNASDIVSKLNGLSQIDLAKVDSYERKHENRATVTNKIESLRGNEPFPGYDELSVDEVRTALEGADEDRVKKVREYERSHKERAGVLEATERELQNA